MNIYAVIILVALLVDFILKLSGNLLNLKALTLDVPPDLVGIYKPEEYRKSQQYIRATTNFSLVESSFTLAILLAFSRSAYGLMR